MLTLTEYTDFRQIFRDELARRCRVRPQYSLRAFARDMEINPPRLSEVLAGKKGLSRTAAIKIGTRLGFNKTENQYFADLVDAQSARSLATRKIAQTKLHHARTHAEARLLQLDAFQIVSDWYHFAILQLMQLSTFRSDHAWIAKMLGIPIDSVNEAMVRMIRLDLIKKNPNGYQLLKDYVTTSSGEIPSEAIRKFHRQVMTKAIAALEEQPTTTRDITTLLMPIDSTKIEAAKKSIGKFKKRFCAEMTSGDQLDQVYSLSIQFFSLLTPNPGAQNEK